MKLKKLKTSFLGKNVFYYNSIDSTQKEIWRRIEKNEIENGDLVIANLQTDAIGTHGRVWYTDEENNIAFSLYIKTNCSVDRINGLTKKIAEIIIQIFKLKYDLNLEIKYPNDIYYSGKKLGGILSETRIISNKVKNIVIGIGINTNKTHFTEDIKNIATSIKKEFGIEINTKEFISEFCNILEKEIKERMVI